VTFLPHRDIVTLGTSEKDGKKALARSDLLLSIVRAGAAGDQ